MADQNKSDDNKQDEIQKSKDKSKDISEEKQKEKQDFADKKKGKTGKPGKEEEKKEKIVVKRIDRGPNFKYIVRLANTDLNGEKNLVYGLKSIKGIGSHMAMFIADNVDINRKTLVGDLSDAQIEKLQSFISNISKTAPAWMVNHRRDYETGQNIHLISTDIDSRLRDEINIMKKIRSYRGIRHERGLKVRGQRTSSNGRKGLALGVSKKKEAPKAAAEETKK